MLYGHVKVIKELKRMYNSVFFILRNQQTAGCSSLTEFRTKELLVLVISTNLKEPHVVHVSVNSRTYVHRLMRGYLSLKEIALETEQEVPSKIKN